MLLPAIIALFLILVLAVIVAFLSKKSFVYQQKVNGIAASFPRTPASGVFDPDAVRNLPEPAQRYLLHAIKPGAPLARTVIIEQKGRMKFKPDSPFSDMHCTEILCPGLGFTWMAKMAMYHLPVSVTDYYYSNDGAVHVEVIHLVAIMNEGGLDVTRSSRGRLAGEAVWCPTSLLPGPNVRWEALDENRARVVQTIDGEEIATDITVDETGRLLKVSLLRYGNVKNPTWDYLPYGFTVLQEQTFGNFTIPTHLQGGWWFGTERYNPDAASTFIIQDVTFY